MNDYGDSEETTLCDLCAKDFPADQSQTCEKCGAECCPFCRIDALCRECDHDNAE